jgi:hypothetical protein
MLSNLQTFIMRNDQDDWRRGLVCGICWVHNAVAINIRQLQILMARCKASINSMFQNIGYRAVPICTEYAAGLSEFFPSLKGNFRELRRWTIRIPKNDSIPTRPILVNPDVAPMPVVPAVGTVGAAAQDGPGDELAGPQHPDGGL